jgi:predicted DNA-binding transcriptional regulator YafY
MQPKKMIIVYILDILRRYSDEDHRLEQKDIVRYLEQDYEMLVDRKSVKRNLMDLVDSGYDIEYSERTRINNRGMEEMIPGGWYINHDFTDGELKLLIESVLFSKHIPTKQCQRLIRKIKDLSSSHFCFPTDNITTFPDTGPENKELFYTMEILNEAISTNKQVSFYYNDYDMNYRLQPRKRETGELRIYRINPYQIVAANGRFYLICNYDKYDGLSDYRLDRITGIKLQETSAKPIKSLHGFENGLDLSRYMAEHIYMFSGDSVRVKFLADLHDRSIVGEIIDWFGRNAVFLNTTADTAEVSVRVNEGAMFYWAMQYGCSVTVLEPESLRNKIAIAVCRMQTSYLTQRSTV